LLPPTAVASARGLQPRKSVAESAMVTVQWAPQVWLFLLQPP